MEHLLASPALRRCPARKFCPANRTPSGGWRLPWHDDPGLAWLAARRAGETVNLTGPYGSGFPLLPLTRRLLLIADAPHLGIVLPLVDEALDRGGQVSLLLLDGGHAPATVDALRGELPLAVEFHRLAAEGWQQEIDGGLRWSDQVCTAIAAAHLPAVADAIRRTRVRFDAGFAFSFVDADLACGYGACLACVVPLANGNLTRACLHGPVFDLLELMGKRLRGEMSRGSRTASSLRRTGAPSPGHLTT